MNIVTPADWETPVFVGSVPAAPTGLAATPGDTLVDLAWTPSITGGLNAPSAQRLYRATANDFAQAVQVGADLGPAVTSAQDTGLTNGTEYFYCLTAVNATGESAASTGDSATPAAASPPATVTAVSSGQQFNSGTTVPIPAHQAGDLILILAERTANVTVPDLPAGWTDAAGLVGGVAGVGRGYRLGYKVAASGAETSGVWKNAQTFTLWFCAARQDSGPSRRMRLPAVRPSRVPSPHRTREARA